MQSVHSLRSKLKSIDSIKTFTGAVKAVSSAKFNKLSAIKRSFDVYTAACTEAAKQLKDSLPAPTNACDCSAYVVFTANKSLCGDYNLRLSKYIGDMIQPHDKVYICGEWGETHLKKRFSPAGIFKRSDIPPDDESRLMANQLIHEFETGTVKNVILVYQGFVNMLNQDPTQRTLLPLDIESDICSECIYVPDKATVARSMLEKYAEAVCRSVMIEASLGSQAATVMAMRSAHENACKLYDDLLLQMNRKRQSTVTSDVLETSSRTRDDE